MVEKADEKAGLQTFQLFSAACLIQQPGQHLLISCSGLVA